MLWKRSSFAGSSVGYRHKDTAVNAARRRTMQGFAFDSHKHYTWALVQDETGKLLGKLFSGHEPAATDWQNRRFCCKCPQDTLGTT
jgi:hypothetical protein